jgi:hypothetical protein
MCAAKDAGMHVSGKRYPEHTVPKHNPNGYWDVNLRTYRDEAPEWDNTVVKLWGKSIGEVGNDRISRLVVLERADKDAQLRSMERVLKDELQLEANAGIDMDASDVLSMFVTNISDWLSGIDQEKILRIPTRDLTARIDEILQFLKGGM